MRATGVAGTLVVAVSGRGVASTGPGMQWLFVLPDTCGPYDLHVLLYACKYCITHCCAALMYRLMLYSGVMTMQNSFLTKCAFTN